MKNAFPFLLILVCIACQKTAIDPSLVKQFTLLSSSNGAQYDIRVALPENYDSTQKYATIYLLDGVEIFNQVVQCCRQYCTEHTAEQVLVVSIGYGNNRNFDYTPTTVNSHGGGAGKFLEFLDAELIPALERDFGADTQRESRIILGHSFGGLLAAYAFTNYNELFGHYLLLSPSIWYDNEVMLNLEAQHRAQNQNRPQLVFMGLGALENNGNMMAPYLAFHQRLKNNYPGMQLTSNLVPGQDHMGSRDPNIKAGLTYYFSHR